MTCWPSKASAQQKLACFFPMSENPDLFGRHLAPVLAAIRAMDEPPDPVQNKV